MNIPEENIENYLSSLKELYKRINSTNSEFPVYLENKIQKYFEPIKILCVTGSGIFPVIERISVNKRVLKGKMNTRIFEVEKLKYPPEKCVVKYGRANLKGQSVFYGTFNFITAVKEMQPEKGDLITISKWKLKSENDILITCPMFMKQPLDNSVNIKLLSMFKNFILDLRRFPPQVSKLIYEIHEFYANCFARKIESNNNQGYIYTAILADKILNYYQNGIVDAIIYPSTQEDFKTENIVIKKESFEDKYMLLETTEKRLLDFSENGDKYIFELLGQSKEIKGNCVIWNN